MTDSKKKPRGSLRELLRNAENRPVAVPVVPTLTRERVEKLLKEGDALRREVEHRTAPMTGRMGPPYNPTKITPEGKSTIQHIPVDQYSSTSKIVDVQIDVRKPVKFVADPTKSPQENALHMTREQCLDMFDQTKEVVWLTLSLVKLESVGAKFVPEDIGTTFPFDKYMRDHAVVTALLRAEHEAAWKEWRRWCSGGTINQPYDVCYNNVVPFMEKLRDHVLVVYGKSCDFDVKTLMTTVAKERREFFAEE
jgi:hypothetical protein